MVLSATLHTWYGESCVFDDFMGCKLNLQRFESFIKIRYLVGYGLDNATALCLAAGVVYTLVQPLLAFFKRLGKFSVVLRTGLAAQCDHWSESNLSNHADEGINNRVEPLSPSPIFQRLVLLPPLYTSVVFLCALLAVRDPLRHIVGMWILIVSIITPFTYKQIYADDV